MRTLERILISATNLLCQLLSVTPGQLEFIRRKRRGPQTLQERPDVFQA